MNCSRKQGTDITAGITGTANLKSTTAYSTDPVLQHVTENKFHVKAHQCGRIKTDFSVAA